MIRVLKNVFAAMEAIRQFTEDNPMRASLALLAGLAITIVASIIAEIC